jgi:hypothetical protein
LATGQFKSCQAAACSAPIPPGLNRHRVCLSHYLDDAFTRLSRTLQDCQQGHPVDSETIDWLIEQGDVVVRLLSDDGMAKSSEKRTELLEMLLCLANVREYMRRHSVSKAT